MRIPTVLALFAWLATPGCGDVAVETDIAYDDRFPVTVLDVYSPPPASTPRPAVMLIHGGGWQDEIRRDTLAANAERLAEAGYVTLNIEYRLVGTGGEFPHAVQDCLCALAWARANAPRLGIDPDRIAGLGYSAGGHLVSMLGAAAHEPVVAPDCAAARLAPAAPFNAVVSGAGPTDMAALPQVPNVISFVGGRLDEVPERYVQASPISHVIAGAPPFLFIHGDADWFVDISHSTKMQAALSSVNSDARMLALPGAGHVWNNVNGSWDIPLTSLDTPVAQAALIDFLDDTIGPVP